jgi:hypothetical protein
MPTRHISHSQAAVRERQAYRANEGRTAAECDAQCTARSITDG